MPPVKSTAEFTKFVNSAVYTLQGFFNFADSQSQQSLLICFQIPKCHEPSCIQKTKYMLYMSVCYILFGIIISMDLYAPRKVISTKSN